MLIGFFSPYLIKATRYYYHKYLKSMKREKKLDRKKNIISKQNSFVIGIAVIFLGANYFHHLSRKSD